MTTPGEGHKVKDNIHPTFQELEAPKHPKDPRFDPNPFEEYHNRVQPAFPNIPRDAFAEWIFPFWHWDHMQTLYGNLDFSRLSFEFTSWDLADCLCIKWYSGFSRVESIENQWTLDYFQEAFALWEEVLNSWMNRGTWFKPIWVLDVQSFGGQILHPDIQLPYMLIEGHGRLGTLRLFAKEGRASGEHSIWLVKFC